MWCSKSENVEIITKIKSNMCIFCRNIFMEFLEVFCMWLRVHVMVAQGMAITTPPVFVRSPANRAKILKKLLAFGV